MIVQARLPVDPKDRKQTPMASGCLDYFPDALAEIARISFKGNEKHNPGQKLHWAREKSTDHADCIIRHFVERGMIDPVDGSRHSAQMAWRALALLQEELEQERDLPPSRGSAPPEPPVSMIDLVREHTKDRCLPSDL